MCRYPLGSGGKRVWTRPAYLLVLRSSRMMSRMKFEGAVEGAGADTAFSPASVFSPASALGGGGFIVYLILTESVVGSQDSAIRGWSVFGGEGFNEGGSAN